MRLVPWDDQKQAKKVSGDMTGKLEKPKGASPVRATDRTAIAREIDENLKRVYTSQLEEEVPDRFLKLLAQLREKEGKP